MVCLGFSSFLDGVCAACCIFLSTAAAMSSHKFTPCAVLRGCKLGAVTQHPEKQAKKPHTASLQQPACTHKEHQMDLTTDGLWAMRLNTGRVPVKAHTLQEWGKLKKYVPIHKQGDVCQNGVPALVERHNNGDNSDSE